MLISKLKGLFLICVVAVNGCAVNPPQTPPARESSVSEKEFREWKTSMEQMLSTIRDDLKLSLELREQAQADYLRLQNTYEQSREENERLKAEINLRARQTLLTEIDKYKKSSEPNFSNQKNLEKLNDTLSELQDFKKKLESYPEIIRQEVFKRLETTERELKNNIYRLELRLSLSDLQKQVMQKNCNLDNFNFESIEKQLQNSSSDNQLSMLEDAIKIEKTKLSACLPLPPQPSEAEKLYKKINAQIDSLEKSLNEKELPILRKEIENLHEEVKKSSTLANAHRQELMQRLKRMEQQIQQREKDEIDGKLEQQQLESKRGELLTKLNILKQEITENQCNPERFNLEALNDSIQNSRHQADFKVIEKDLDAKIEEAKKCVTPPPSPLPPCCVPQRERLLVKLKELQVQVQQNNCTASLFSLDKINTALQTAKSQAELDNIEQQLATQEQLLAECVQTQLKNKRIELENQLKTLKKEAQNNECDLKQLGFDKIEQSIQTIISLVELEKLNTKLAQLKNNIAKCGNDLVQINDWFIEGKPRSPTPFPQAKATCQQNAMQLVPQKILTAAIKAGKIKAPSQEPIAEWSSTEKTGANKEIYAVRWKDNIALLIAKDSRSLAYRCGQPK